MPVGREEEYGLKFPQTAAVARGVVDDLADARSASPAQRAGIQTRGTLATIPAVAADVAAPVGRAIRENVIDPVTGFAKGLFGAGELPKRTPRAAAPVVTPQTAKPNARPAPPPAAPAKPAVDTSKYPYGLDIRKLRAQFPAAGGVPAASANGLNVRERQPGQNLAPVIPRAPTRQGTKDLDRRERNIAGALTGVSTGSGGFGDLLRYRLALGFAQPELAGLARQRAQRGQQYEDAFRAYEAEQGLGLKLGELGLNRRRLAEESELGRAELAQRARQAEQENILGQIEQARGLLALEQEGRLAQQTARAKAAKEARDAYKIFQTERVDPETGEVLKSPNLFYGLGPEGPLTAPLGGGGLVDPLDVALPY